jgi:glutathione S-transferase
MLKLYHHHTSVCAAKTRQVLAEKALEFEGEIIRLRERDQHTPEYLAMNPFGLVPVLVHDGKVVTESNVINEYLDVINEYLDDVFPTPPLKPRDPYKCAQMRVWTRMTDENIHAAAGVVTTAIAYRHVPSHGNQIAGQLDPYKQARKIAAFDGGLDNAHFRTAMRRYDMLMDQIEAALGGKGPGQALAGGGPDWLIGDYSLADIAMAPYMERLNCCALEFLWADRPRVSDWYARLKARPAYQQAILDWFDWDITWTDLMRSEGEKVQDQVRAIVEEMRDPAYGAWSPTGKA